MRELRELLVWLDKVYDSNIKEMRDSWLGLVSAMEGGSTGAVSLDTMESHKVALPSSQAFRFNDSMFSNSRSGSNPEIYIGRATLFREKNSSENLEKKVVLARASNLVIATCCTKSCIDTVNTDARITERAQSHGKGWDPFCGNRLQKPC
jgi:hypothetical protein